MEAIIEKESNLIYTLRVRDRIFKEESGRENDIVVSLSSRTTNDKWTFTGQDFAVTPEELLAFTRDLAEMQGYALMEKEPEHWVPLAEGWYVRDKESDTPIAWFPDSYAAARKVTRLGNYPFTYESMAYLHEWSGTLKMQDFAPLRKQYYLNNSNP